jgi:holo-[acyl-carrier protein] synthase
MSNHRRDNSPDFAVEVGRLLSNFDFATEEVRVGIDVVCVSQLEKQSTTKAGLAFTQSRFTKDELSYCEDRPERLAARWAAKEAVVKAIGSGFRGIRPRDIEIRHESWGEPTVVCPPGAAWPNDAHLWTWAISLAHENDAAVAVALAVVNQRSSREMQGTAKDSEEVDQSTKRR